MDHALYLTDIASACKDFFLEFLQGVLMMDGAMPKVALHPLGLRPDRFRAVIGLSVPFRPRGALRPTSVMSRTEEAVFYQFHFQEPGVAEAELERDVRAAVRDILLRPSGDVPPIPGSDGFNMVPVRGGLGGRLAEHAGMALPDWLSEADIDAYAEAFGRSGFRGGLNH